MISSYVISIIRYQRIKYIGVAYFHIPTAQTQNKNAYNEVDETDEVQRYLASSVLNHSTLESRDFSKRAPGV